jgi:biotin carboxylase
LLLDGKRLLFLGAGHFQVPAIQAARELGCFVIVTDNVPGNPGHGLASVSENVSTIDLEACLALARKHGVHGVMTYGSDVSTPAVAYVAEELGLPGNPFKSATILQRKDLVRAFQKQHGLNHPVFLVLESGAELTRYAAELATFPFPGVVKPVDASGSKGISIVRSEADLNVALPQAAAFSRKGLLILEQLLEQDMLELDGDVWIKGGKLAFRHYGHNYFSKNRPSMVPMGEIFPGYFSDRICEELDAQFEALIRGLELRDGCMNFDGAVSGGKVYLFDVALRNGGNYVPLLIQRSTGFDITRAAVCSALGVEFPCPGRAATEPRPVASYVLNANEEGVFDGIDIASELREYVCDEKLFVARGAHVLPFTRGDRALGMLIFAFPDMHVMREKMGRVEDLVRIKLTT